MAARLQPPWPAWAAGCTRPSGLFHKRSTKAPDHVSGAFVRRWGAYSGRLAVRSGSSERIVPGAVHAEAARGARVRVLMVTNTYAPARNGVAMWVALSVRELRARGHEVEILTYAHDRREPGDETVHEVPAWFGIDPDFKVTPFSPSVPESLHEATWDVVHVHHPILLGPVGIRYARERGAAVCATFHSLYSDYFAEYYHGAGRFLRGWFDRKVARFADGCDVVFAPSSSVERWLREHDVSAKTVRLDPPADTSRIHCSGREAARSALGIGERPVAFYIGRIADEKRVDVLVDEFAGALDAMPDGALLVLGGTGKRLPGIQRKVERLGLADRVWTLGPLSPDELGDWYSAADICVSASRSETGPLTAVEAMACGCPVVALDAPGFEDRVEHGVNGLLAEDRPRGLGEAMASVLRDPALRARLSEGAVSRACDCSPAAVTDRMVAAYREMAGIRSGA